MRIEDYTFEWRMNDESSWSRASRSGSMEEALDWLKGWVEVCCINGALYQARLAVIKTPAPPGRG